MLDEILQSKIDLLQEQIDNLEKSGHYTDAEIQIQTKPLRIELNLIKDSLSFEFLTIAELRELSVKIQHAIVTRHSSGTGMVLKFQGILTSLKKEANDFLTPKPNQYGMSDEEYADAKYKHNSFFAPINELKLEVVDAEILTPNHQEA